MSRVCRARRSACWRTLGGGRGRRVRALLPRAEDIGWVAPSAVGGEKAGLLLHPGGGVAALVRVPKVAHRPTSTARSDQIPRLNCCEASSQEERSKRERLRQDSGARFCFFLSSHLDSAGYSTNNYLVSVAGPGGQTGGKGTGRRMQSRSAQGMMEDVVAGWGRQTKPLSHRQTCRHGQRPWTFSPSGSCSSCDFPPPSPSWVPRYL